MERTEVVFLGFTVPVLKILLLFVEKHNLDTNLSEFHLCIFKIGKLALDVPITRAVHLCKNVAKIQSSE